MMKIHCAVAFAVSVSLAATVHAAPSSAAMAGADSWRTAHFQVDFYDITQAWYFTGEALAGPPRDGAPLAVDRPLFKPADAGLVPLPAAVPATPAIPARVDVPPTIPEPRMASMLLVGLLLILLRTGRKEELFG
ncbi:hypothetical protein [Massilia sp. METH4]|uniref:hypothetical protein n=1 Tax=Massilia sp. METH4 TaxID=3123041 RepID=UPI0030CBF1E3